MQDSIFFFFTFRETTRQIIEDESEAADAGGVGHRRRRRRRELHLGDSFGITPTMEKLYHKGVMRTTCDDCQFVCVTQADYYRILHQVLEDESTLEDSETVFFSPINWIENH